MDHAYSEPPLLERVRIQILLDLVSYGTNGGKEVAYAFSTMRVLKSFIQGDHMGL